MWLGGRKVDGQWQWVDNTTWNFENWKSGFPESYEYLLMLNDGQWRDYISSYKAYFLCQGPTAALTESVSISIEFSKEQMAFFPFHLIFKSHAIDQPTLNATSGFSLNWFLKDSNGSQVTEKLPARREDWKKETLNPSYKEPLLHDMVQLAKELRLQNKAKEEILKEVIHHKSKTNVMREAGN